MVRGALVGDARSSVSGGNRRASPLMMHSVLVYAYLNRSVSNLLLPRCLSTAQKGKEFILITLTYAHHHVLSKVMMP